MPKRGHTEEQSLRLLPRSVQAGRLIATNAFEPTQI
jgi:hypothetical protein